MPHVTRSTYRAAAFVAAALLTACNMPEGASNEGTPPVEPALRAQRPSTSASQYLYILGARAIYVYPIGSTELRRTLDDLNTPVSMSVDVAGRVYAANYSTDGHGHVVTYKPNSGKVLRTISNGINYPGYMSAGPSNLLYVSNDLTTQNVAVISGNGARLQRIINGTSNVEAFAFDQQNNVYIANGPLNDVNVYSPGGKKLLARITKAVKYPLDAIFGPDGYLYVASCGHSCTPKRSGSNGKVTEYDSADYKLVRTISTGLNYPQAIAFDGAGNLYVANKGPHPPGSVSVYAPNGSTPSKSITSGIDDPRSLATDSSGALYVANAASNTVSIYPALQTIPSATIDVTLNAYAHQVQVGP